MYECAIYRFHKQPLVFKFLNTCVELFFIYADMEINKIPVKKYVGTSVRIKCKI